MQGFLRTHASQSRNLGLKIGRYQAFASSLVGCCRNRLRACGEELLLLQLDALPRRIAKHTIESAFVHHLAKA